MLRVFLCLGLMFFFLQIKGQGDTSKPWFPGGDEGFYQYLEERLQAGNDQYFVSRSRISGNGYHISFEFAISDSGFVTDIKVYGCDNTKICNKIYSILQSLGRVNNTKTENSQANQNRVYSILVQKTGDFYHVLPLAASPSAYGRTKNTVKWAIVFSAVLVLFVLIIKP